MSVSATTPRIAAIEAEAAARHAVGLVEGTGFLNFYGDAQMALAEVLRIGGRSEEAARAAVQAIQAYERKGNVVSAATTEARLEELRRCEG